LAWLLLLAAVLLFAGCDEDEDDSKIKTQDGPAVPRFLYVPNGGDDSVSAFAIDSDSGALSEIDGSPFAVGDGPREVAVSPGGEFLFVGEYVGGTVATFAIDGDSGAISLVSGSRQSTGGSPREIALHPSGERLYAANESLDIAGFAVAEDGTLSELPGSPYPLGDTWVVEADPLGDFIFGGSENALVESHVILSSGALARAVGSPYDTTSQHYGIAVHSDGTFVYVGSGIEPYPYVFSVNRDSGELTAAGTPSIGHNIEALAMHPAGDFLYMSSTSGELTKANIKSDGLFSGLVTITPGSSIGGLTVDGTGAFLYAMDTTQDEVLGFRIDLETGELTEISGANVATGSFPLIPAVFVGSVE
jgi:6-phosphogluconolactonase (cycloisomerase 2 family)